MIEADTPDRRALAMTFVLALGYLAAVGLVVSVGYFIFTAVRGALTGRKRKWVKRSGVDRRQRNVPVQKNRRQSPRRQEDIAQQFLTRVGG